MSKFEMPTFIDVVPDIVIGDVVHYYDPRLSSEACDGVGKGPHMAQVLKVTPAKGDVPQRLHLRVPFWGSDRWVPNLIEKGSRFYSNDMPYWERAPRV